MMRIETQFSVFVVNRPGVLAAVTAALADAKVNITALSLSDSGEQGVLRMVCSDAEKTRAVLSKEHDRWTETQVLVVELGNTPGSFATACAKLAAEKANITYAYCTSGASDKSATAVFKMDDLDKAKAILK